MATDIINGTAGNDLIAAHPESAYDSGQLVFVLGGMPSQGVWPAVNIMVNGQVVAPNVVITSYIIEGHTQVVRVPLPAGTVVSSVGLRYFNDLVTQVDDRNVYVGSVTLNGHQLPLDSGVYVYDDYPATAGIHEMNWNGTMTWSGAVVSNAMAGGTQANNVAIDGSTGFDAVTYVGRESAYDVAYAPGGVNVTIKNGAFPTDTVRNVENVLFDDRGAYGGGYDAVVDVNAGTIDGGRGIDTLVLQGAHTQYFISHTATGFSVAGNGVNEWVTNVERLQFSDGWVGLDIAGNCGMAYRLYQAAFNRVPDVPGLGYQATALDNGLTIAQVAGNFIASPEFQSTYGALTTEQFVRQLYLNVLHREPEAEGFAYHVNNLNNNGYTRADVLVGFSESPENQANVIGAIQDGMYYLIG